MYLTKDEFKKHMLDAHARGMLDGVESVVVTVKKFKDVFETEPVEVLIAFLDSAAENTRARITKELEKS